MKTVYYNNGVYLASGEDNGIWYSANGVRWWQSNITTGSFGCIYYGNGMYLAGSSIGLYYSTDAIHWYVTNVTSGYEYNKDSILYFDNGGVNITPHSETGYYAGNLGGGAWYSSDGITWTQNSNTSVVTVNSLSIINRVVIACVDDNGLIILDGYSNNHAIDIYIDGYSTSTTTGAGQPSTTITDPGIIAETVAP
jgi:hypothetical protein